MRYRAKKNILVLAILWLVYLGPLVLTVFLLIQRADPVGIFFGFFIIVVVDGLLLLVTSPSYYEITPAFLCARIGIMRVDIPLEAIQQVVAERTLGKPGGLSLAWSFDRLRVDYRGNGQPTFVYIAPKDKSTFLENLVAQAPGLAFHNGRIIRLQSIPHQ